MKNLSVKQVGRLLTHFSALEFQDSSDIPNWFGGVRYISIRHIDYQYIATFKKYRYWINIIDQVIFENIDIDKELSKNIDIDKKIFKNINVEKDILRNIDIDIDKGIIKILIW